MDTFPEPVAGIDYPRNLQEFDRWFADETACRSYVFRVRCTHSRTVLSESGDPAHVAMPGVHRIASLLKRWLLGIHQGAVSGKHLDYYLDEYTFRFNRRTSRSRGMLFYRLMQQAGTTASTPYRQLVDGNHKM